MNDIVPKKRTPPAKSTKSRQYELFSTFFGDADDLSNTIELWDAIPKYSVSARRQVHLRDAKGRLAVHEYEFTYKSRACRLVVQPASIKEGGKYRDFYPSTDEELVEEVIRKVFADQRYGIHDPPNAESWVRFSLSMIRKELAGRGKARSIDEIKRSIEILANTSIRLYVSGEDEDEPIYTNTILSDLTKVTRKSYLDDPDAMWAARLPALISKSVNEMTFRQFSYGTFMALPTQLARWLHKRLSHNYVNAGYANDYTVLFSTLKRDSGLLESERVNTNVKALEKALDELAEAGVLFEWSKEERRGARNKLDDVLYTLKAHPDFIAQMKAANARNKGGLNGPPGRHKLPGRR
ncbi:MAG: hypothetical protein AAGN64_00215 [Bacteroidota bacterium]